MSDVSLQPSVTQAPVQPGPPSPNVIQPSPAVPAPAVAAAPSPAPVPVAPKAEDFFISQPEGWPEGVSFDEDVAKSAAGVIAELLAGKFDGKAALAKLALLTGEQQKALLDVQAQQVEALRADGVKKIAAAWGGAASPEREERAIRAANTQFGPELAQILKDGGAAAYPELFIGLEKFADVIGEAGLGGIGGGAASAGAGEVGFSDYLPKTSAALKRRGLA